MAIKFEEKKTGKDAPAITTPRAAVKAVAKADAPTSEPATPELPFAKPTRPEKKRKPMAQKPARS